MELIVLNGESAPRGEVHYLVGPRLRVTFEYWKQVLVNKRLVWKRWRKWSWLEVRPLGLQGSVEAASRSAACDRGACCSLKSAALICLSVRKQSLTPASFALLNWAKAAAEICDLFIDVLLLPGCKNILQDLSKSSDYYFTVECATTDP